MNLFKKKSGSSDERRWNEGDEMVVTGDTAGVGHEFETGEEVTLQSYDVSDGTWRCEGANDFWWVSPQDLQPKVKPPTDKELKAALKSIQQSANNLKKPQ